MAKEDDTVTFEDVESLCILWAVAYGARTIDDIATKLGLSKDVASAISSAVMKLAARGWVNLAGAIELTNDGAMFVEKHDRGCLKVG